MKRHVSRQRIPGIGGLLLPGDHTDSCRTLLIPDHGLNAADIGGKITAKDGYVFIIMQIPKTHP